MVALLVSGALLTMTRMPSLEAVFTTRLGILLLIKLFLFSIMLCSAVVVTVYIGPRLRRQKSLRPQLVDGVCTADALCQFDGKDGRPAYVAYQGAIYDVTNSKLWKNGSHVTKHSAGGDLSDLMK